MSDMKSKFEAALAARQQQKAAEAARTNGGSYGDYPDIPYTALVTDKQRVFRFVGLPYSVRENATDSKRIHIAMILGDDDKKFRCIGPDPHEQGDWILYRVMNKVLVRHWDKNLPGNNGKMGGYVYDNAKKHPELYTRVAKNNSDNPFEQGWRFSASILFNVIDREDYQWHKENKKLRVLSKRMSEGNDRVYFDPGVPDTVYQQVIDEIVAVDGNTNWEDYDIVITKMSDKPWYKAYHGVDDIKKIDADLRRFIIQTGLTDEERSWERNDFDALFPVTKYKRIKAKVGIFFQRVDAAFNTHYFDELCDLVDKEEQDDAQKESEQQPATRGATPTAPAAQNNNPAVEEPLPPPPPLEQHSAPPVRGGVSAPVAKDGVIPMTDAIWKEIENGTRKWRGEAFKGVSSMTAEERAMVIGIKENNQFEWKHEAGELFEGAQSGFLAPAMCHIDPASAQVFDDAPPF